MVPKDLIPHIDEKMVKTINALSREFSEINTGRAHPGLVEGLHVDYYGTPTLLKQMASITTPDAHLLVIQPWDISAIAEIEKAIMKSGVGVSPINDGKVVKLVLPQLSKERREELAKSLKHIAEESRVSLRTIRRDANDMIKKMEQDKAMTEDEKFKAQESVQKLTDKYIAKVGEIVAEKEKELMAF